MIHEPKDKWGDREVRGEPFAGRPGRPRPPELAVRACITMFRWSLGPSAFVSLSARIPCSFVYRLANRPIHTFAQGRARDVACMCTLGVVRRSENATRRTLPSRRPTLRVACADQAPRPRSGCVDKSCCRKPNSTRRCGCVAQLLRLLIPLLLVGRSPPCRL